MSERKSFFKERTASEILELQASKAFKQRGLVERISELDVKEDSLIIMAQLIPGEHFIGKHGKILTARQASMKWFHHPKLIALSQPKLQSEAYESRKIPLDIRKRDFTRLKTMQEDEIPFIGYSFRPVQGGDDIKRYVPFVFCAEGQRLFAYSEQIAEKMKNPKMGISINFFASAEKAKRVSLEGAEAVFEVPSRTRRKPKYHFALEHIPLEKNKEKNAIIWSLRPKIVVDSEFGEPETSRPEHSIYNIRYNSQKSRERSELITFYPHDIAAYIKFEGETWKEGNMTPMKMNPFVLFSREGAEFYKKLCSNVLIFDPTLTSKEKLRHLHITEKSLLLARAIGKYGHDRIAYWDPSRDGKLKDYDWNI